MEKDNTPLTRVEFTKFADNVIGIVKDIAKYIDQNEQYNKKLADKLNKAFSHVYQRFDDVDQRLDRIEQKLVDLEKDSDEIKRNVHYVRNDTRVLPSMFDLVRSDVIVVENLKRRVKKLEKP